MATPKSFPPEHRETPANGGISGGGGNRTREGFPLESCVGCWRPATLAHTLPSGRVAALCETCFKDRALPCVYFIRSGDLVKIGYTKRLSSRLSAYRTHSPIPCEVWHFEAGGPELEAELHERFAADRAHGEWFRVTDAMRDFIESRAREPEAAANS